MSEENFNLAKFKEDLEKMRKARAEESAQASAIIEKHFKNAGLPFRKSGETKTWESCGWDLYLNVDDHFRDEENSPMLKAMFVELVDFCEISTSESFAYIMKVLLEKFISQDPPRSRITPLLPQKALAQFDEINQMLDDDHERYLEILDQQGY